MLQKKMWSGYKWANGTIYPYEDIYFLSIGRLIVDMPGKQGFLLFLYVIVILISITRYL